MTEKEFIKAKVIFGKIKALDNEIVKIDRMILDSLENDFEHNVLFKSIDHKIDNKVGIDSNGSLMFNSTQGLFERLNAHVPFWSGKCEPEKKQDVKNELDLNLSVTEYVMLLKGVLNIKEQQRVVLINELESFGIKL